MHVIFGYKVTPVIKRIVGKQYINDKNAVVSWHDVNGAVAGSG